MLGAALFQSKLLTDSLRPREAYFAECAGKFTGCDLAFFDPDKDPIFVQGVPMNKGYAFLSFMGEVHEVDFSAAQPAFHPPWSLVTAAEKGHWRTGGTQVGAIHRGSGKLFVPMHEGGEGSHKDGGTEIWVFDMKTHQRLARWPMARAKLAPILAVQVSQDDAPLLFAASSQSDLGIFDALTGQLHHVEKQMGQTPWLLLTP